MKAAIIDDDVKYTQLLQGRLTEMSGQFPLIIETFLSGEAFLESRDKFDLLFLDIELDGINGLETAEKFREKGEKALIIFLTSHMEFCQNGYLVNAYRFLDKNDDKARFHEAVGSAFHVINSRRKLVVYTLDNFEIFLDYDDMICIEVHNRGTCIHTITGDLYSREKISTMASLLEGSWVYQPHRAFLINLNHCIKYDKQNIYLSRQIVVPLSEKKRNEFQKRLT